MANLEVIYRVIHQQSGFVVHDFDREDSAIQCAEDENEEYPDSHIVVKYVRADHQAQHPAALTVLQDLSERFSAMHANGDVWITSVAAAKMAQTAATQAQQPAAAVPDRSAIDDAIWRVLDRHNCNGSDRRLRVELIEAVFSVMAADNKENGND